ncbi:hypothetical protein FJT64_003004 [Amphibalanus amphitrite]|uniref:Mab-21-like HhH/H2TH-like domain-containing protein n=1 Tax=Amphibalanus amphitrite TaxID=1232801 RepID=A0A6A4WJD4_AMPAM|nr:hypothetical protein FJT64_003004 [Amphibalanus amphitrite]
MADLAISSMVRRELQTHSVILYAGLVTNTLRNSLLWLAHAPLWTVLQRAEAAVAECRNCTPFGRLSVLQISQSGSTAESFSDIKPGQPSTSDHDAMYELGPCRWQVPWTGGDEPAAQGVPEVSPAPGRLSGAAHRPPPLLRVEPCATPGFVTLWVMPEVGCAHDSPLPLSAATVRRLMFNMQRVKHKLEDSITITGPSAALDGPSQIYGGIDMVSCFHLPVWPAAEFRTRHRANQFPPAAARDDICRFGVHLVPTGHKASCKELFEAQLRLSFSRAEVVAAWHMNQHQQTALKRVKRLKNELKKTGAVQLKSYFIKTAVLWLCQDASIESWSSITEAVSMILSWLENAVNRKHLPCFFWAEINLLDGFSAADLEATKDDIGRMREDLTRALLAQCIGQCAMDPLLAGPPEPLIRAGAPSAGSYSQQLLLLHAFLVAPDDVIGEMRLTSTGDGLLAWDAAPLFRLLTDQDMNELFGSYEAVQAWWSQQLSLPPAERPPGLTVPLDTPQGQKELLLNAELHTQACSASIPRWKTVHALLDHLEGQRWKNNNLTLPSKQRCKEWLQDLRNSDLEEKLRRSDQIDSEKVADLAEQWRREMDRYLLDTGLGVDYDILRTQFQDRWWLRQYVLAERLVAEG